MLFIALTMLAASSQQQTPALKVPADSYADSATASLVQHARAARSRNERLVTSYTAKVSQRMGIGLHALARDRMIYRQEMVAQISWFRDKPSTIEIEGAREGIPIAIRGDQVPDDLRSNARDVIIDPASDYLRGLGGDNEELVLYPLSDGGEASYRFALDKTVTMTLPGGKTLRIVGLTVIPRISSPKLMSGTLWFDAETYNIVRAVYRPARPWDLRRDATTADKKDVPGWVSGQLEVKYVTLDYGLYSNRWWMPRFMAIDGEGTSGSWLGVPFRMETTYDYDDVQGGTPPDTAKHFIPAGQKVKSDRRLPRNSPGIDSATRARINANIDSMAAVRDSNLRIVVPADTAALLHSPLLGKPILEMGDMVSEAEVKALAAPLKQLPDRPWETHLTVPHSLSSLLQKARYNRIEALSLGTSARLDFGRLQMEVTGRIGLADLVPNGELSLTRATKNGKVVVTGYRRLAAANPETNPFSAPNSALALIAQRDDGEYFRTLGAEVTTRNANSGWWSARAYYQRETPALKITNAALPNLFSNRQLFRPNIIADSATEIGGSLTLRKNKAFSRSVNIGFSTTLDATTGDFDFNRGSANLHAIITPAKGPLAVALTASAGTSTGTLSTQGQFFLGGPTSLRGYPGGAMSGSAFWLGRADVGTGIPGARLIGFSDVGWAGARNDFSKGTPLIGAGVGASFLDGLVRVDLARALRGTKGWRLEFYIDGPM